MSDNVSELLKDGVVAEQTASLLQATRYASDTIDASRNEAEAIAGLGSLVNVLRLVATESRFKIDLDTTILEPMLDSPQAESDDDEDAESKEEEKDEDDGDGRGGRDKDYKEDSEDEEDEEERPLVLKHVSMGLADDEDIEGLQSRMNRFVNALEALDLNMLPPSPSSHHKKPKYPKLTGKEVYDIANALGPNLCSLSNYNRLRSISEYVNNPKNEDQLAHTRAGNAARDRNLPQLIRNVFQGLYDAGAYVVKSQVHIKGILSTHGYLEAYLGYLDVIDAAIHNKGGVRAQLLSGRPAKQGVQWASHAKRYFANALGHRAPTKFNHWIRIGQVVSYFCGEMDYTVGFICLAPPPIWSLLVHIGVQKAWVVSRCYKWAFGKHPVRTICRILDREFLCALRSGRAITIKLPSPGHYSILSGLENAEQRSAPVEDVMDED